MDNKPTNNSSEEQNTAFKSQPVKPVRATRTKPTVEGINSLRAKSNEPVVKISLTPQEEDLISETGSSKPAIGNMEKNNQKILPQSLIDRMEKKPTHYKMVFSIFIILLALVAGAYKFYISYVNAHIPPQQNIQPYLNSEPVQDQSAAALFSSTTPNAINGQTASGSPDSSLASTTPANASTTVSGASSTPVAVPTPAPQPQLTISSTPTGYLNVRSQPSTSATVITQVHPGESYGYSQTQNGWYLITLTNGQMGWVSGQYVTLQ